MTATEKNRGQAWKSYAQSYDRILPKLPFYQEVVRRHVAAMSRAEIREIIDAGAGTGNVSIELAERGKSVTAVDMSIEMLNCLRLKSQLKHGSSITIVNRDAQDLSIYADASFDGATILLAFFDMTQPRRALAEVIRVLRPGGFLVTTETKRDFHLEPLLVFVERFLKEQSLYVDLHDDWIRVREANVLLDPGKHDSRLTVDEIEEQLRISGFVIDQVKDSHLGQCATIWATKGGILGDEKTSQT